MPRFKNQNFTKSIIFDGSNDGVTFLKSEVTPSTTAFSFCFWMFNQSAAANNDRIIDWSDAGPTNGFTVSLDSTVRRFAFNVYNAGSAQANIVSTTGLGFGIWYHVACVYAVNAAKLFVNGAQVGATDTGVTMTDASAADISIGKRTTGATNLWNGLMSDFLFFNSLALTAAQVQNIYYSRVNPQTPDVLITFDNAIADTSGNNRTISSAGSPAFSSILPGHYVARTAVT